MPIQPVSGEIKAQPLNDNFSYLDSKVDQVSGGPKETFTSESALKSKYPNGSNSAMMVTDSEGKNGYLYTWNGSTWVRGQLYQPQGIADNSVELRKFGIGVVRAKPNSNNLIELSKVKWDKYVDFASGQELVKTDYCFVTVPVDGGKTYEIFNTTQQGCFLNSSGSYLSGWISVPSFPKPIPTNAAYICQTFKQEEIEEGYIALVNQSYHLPDVLDTNAILDESLGMTKNAYPQFLDGNINLFEKDRAERGKYVDFATGKLVVNENHSASDFIEIDPRIKWIEEGNGEQLAFYDRLKRYVGGVQYASSLPDTEISENVRYIRLTVKNSNLDDTVLRPVQKLNPKWADNNFVNTIGRLLGIESKEVVTVKKDGTGDYTSLRNAIKTSADGATIKLYDDFKLEDEYSVSEIKQVDFQGYPLQKNQTIEGIGDVTISANLDPTIFSTEDITRVSTITPIGDGSLKNLTIVGESVRYAFHPETDSNNLYCENVMFIKKNSGSYCQAMAGGTRSGQKHKYKYCSFYTEWTGTSDIPASYHTNTNFNLPCSIIFEDCNFNSPNSKYELRLGGMASNQINVVELIGNRLSRVLVKEERMDGVGLDYLIRGRGNRKLTFTQQSKSGSESAQYDFVEEIEVI